MKKSPNWLKILISGLIGIGIFLRLFHYIRSHSITVDEVYLLSNIIGRNYSGLLRPLSLNQGAPIGFLFIEKFLINTFGDGELVLRFFPFLCSILSILIFYKIALRYLEKTALSLAVGYFAISPYLLYYTGNFKQYSSDVLVGLLCFDLIDTIRSKNLHSLNILILGLLGSILLWFSFPAIFILAGVGTGLLISYLLQKDWGKTLSILIISLFWVLSFSLFYIVSLRYLLSNTSLSGYWKGGFLQFNLKHLINLFLKIFQIPLGFHFLGLAAFAFCLGCVYFLRKNKERFLFLILPIIFTLLATFLHKYPFMDRQILFLLPIFSIFIFAGIEILLSKRDFMLKISGGVLIALLVMHPLAESIKANLKPYLCNEIKPVLRYVYNHHREGDILYLYYPAWPPFRYYSRRYNFKLDDCVEGVSSEKWEDFEKDLKNLVGKRRVWVIFSHICTSRYVFTEKFGVYLLNKWGKRLDSYAYANSSAYLYDLGQSKCSKPHFRNKNEKKN